ncbi:MAG: hypothetical protein E6772_08085 [Dysgonomonas sp.]|nr:hypothetical protein [Dysgonomonas sp.]
MDNKKDTKENDTINEVRKNKTDTSAAKKDIAGLLDFVRKVYALKK